MHSSDLKYNSGASMIHIPYMGYPMRDDNYDEALGNIAKDGRRPISVAEVIDKSLRAPEDVLEMWRGNSFVGDRRVSRIVTGDIIVDNNPHDFFFIRDGHFFIENLSDRTYYAGVGYLLEEGEVRRLYDLAEHDENVLRVERRDLKADLGGKIAFLKGEKDDLEFRRKKIFGFKSKIFEPTGEIAVDIWKFLLRGEDPYEIARRIGEETGSDFVLRIGNSQYPRAASGLEVKDFQISRFTPPAFGSNVYGDGDLIGVSPGVNSPHNLLENSI